MRSSRVRSEPSITRSPERSTAPPMSVLSSFCLMRTVRLHCAIDPAVLGGAIVQADDLVIDGSVRTGLTQLAAAAAG